MNQELLEKSEEYKRGFLDGEEYKQKELIKIIKELEVSGETDFVKGINYAKYLIIERLKPIQKWEKLKDDDEIQFGRYNKS